MDSLNNTYPNFSVKLKKYSKNDEHKLKTGSEKYTFSPKKEKPTKYINVKSGHAVIKKGLIPEKLSKAAHKLFPQGTDLYIALRIMHKLWNLHCQWIAKNATGTFPLSKEYKLGIINNNRNKYYLFKKLESGGLYKSSSYSTARNQCKMITLNPDFTKGKLVEIHYNQHYEVKPLLDSASERVAQVISKLEFPHNSLGEIQELVKAHKYDIETRIRLDIIVDQDKPTYKGETVDGPLENFIIQKIEAVSNKHATLLYPMINIEDAYCGRNSTNRRMDHILTRVPAIYLPYFRLSGENLIEIDFKNCQPCLLAHFLKKILKKESWIYKIPYIKALLNNSGIKDSNHSLFSVLENLICQSDIVMFCDQCYKGTLYDSFVGPNDPDKKRDEVKKLFMQANFGKYWQVERSDQYQFIKEKYPNYLNLINKIKKYFAMVHLNRQTESLVDNRPCRIQKKQKTAKEAGSDELSILLQAMESYLFIDILLQKILDEGLDVIPRHDSFLMKESDSEKVWEIMINTFNEILGEGKFQLRKKPLIR